MTASQLPTFSSSNSSVCRRLLLFSCFLFKLLQILTNLILFHIIYFTRALWNRVPLPVEEEYDSSVDDNEMGGDMGDFDMDEDEYGNGKRSGKSASQEGSSSKMKSDTDIKAFLDIIGDMVTSGQADGHSPDNLLMEIKGYKFAQNKVTSLFNQ